MLRALIGMVCFTIAASFLTTLVQHFYADLSYTYRFWDDWKWVREQSRIGDLFLLDLLLYGIASGIGYLALIILTGMGIRPSGTAKIAGMAIVLILTLLVIISSTVGIASFFSIRVLIALVILLLPVLFINFFLGRPSSSRI